MDQSKTEVLLWGNSLLGVGIRYRRGIPFYGKLLAKTGFGSKPGLSERLSGLIVLVKLAESVSRDVITFIIHVSGLLKMCHKHDSFLTLQVL